MEGEGKGRREQQADKEKERDQGDNLDDIETHSSSYTKQENESERVTVSCGRLQEVTIYEQSLMRRPETTLINVSEYGLEGPRLKLVPEQTANCATIPN